MSAGRECPGGREGDGRRAGRRSIQREARLALYRWARRNRAARPAALLPPPDAPADLLRSRRLKKQLAVLEAIVGMLEARDAYTVDHSRRVAALCLRVCLLLRLPRRRSALIVSAAAVHDIGKVEVRDAVLHKAGPLTDGEFQEIKGHPGTGSQLLRKNRALSCLAGGVRHHYERWDGAGYPDGLRGEDIHLSARIIALCDSIDAMRTDRSYRKALSGEACREELRRNAGVRYDPALTALCLEQFDHLTDGLYPEEAET